MKDITEFSDLFDQEFLHGFGSRLGQYESLSEIKSTDSMLFRDFDILVLAFPIEILRDKIIIITPLDSPNRVVDEDLIKEGSVFKFLDTLNTVDHIKIHQHQNE